MEAIPVHLHRTKSGCSGHVCELKGVEAGLIEGGAEADGLAGEIFSRSIFYRVPVEGKCGVVGVRDVSDERSGRI